MRQEKIRGGWALQLAAGVALLAIAAAPSARAEVTVTETPGRLAIENESVRVVFNPALNHVPSELVDKRASGRNLIAGSFCLYYQYIEGGALRSVNEGYPGGQISNGRHRLEKSEGGATLEFTCDTPHFHMTRRVTVPAAGPAVKFVYELECTKSDRFEFYLPYAPLTEKFNRSARQIRFINRKGARERRLAVEEVKSPKLRPGSPFTETASFHDLETGEGLTFAHLKAECAAGITRRETPRFEVGARERCAFQITLFQGDPEKRLAAALGEERDESPNLANASSAVLIQRAPGWILWADHSTRRIFPQEKFMELAAPSAAVAIEAARGEYEPFQVVLTPRSDLDGVRVIPGALAGANGESLGPENITCHPIGSLLSSFGEEIPDLLLQKEAVPIKKGQNGVFWITVRVPPATAAGTYRGALSLVSSGEKLAEIRLQVKVWDFALSPTPHICAFSTDYVYYHEQEVDLNNPAEVAAHARKTAGDEEEADHYPTRMKFFADHRIYETFFGPRPRGAMRIDWRQKPDQRWDFTGIDFTEFDKARSYCYDELHWPRFAYDPELVPYLEFINQYTFGGKEEKEYWYMRYWDPVLPRKDPEKYRPSIYDLNDDFTPEFKEKFLRYIKTISEHCRAKGISIDQNGNGPVLFLADEIPAYSTNHAVVKKTLELARLIKGAEPRAVLVVNAPEVPDDPEIIQLFDLWTARCSPAMLAKLRSLGKRYGDYYMHGYFDLRSPALAPRVQFWSYWKYDFFWIGDWAMTVTPDMRWYGRSRNYGNNWWFPSMKGRHGEPMSTIRFELMREGLEDHEYLWMLRDLTARLRAGAKDLGPGDGPLARAGSLLEQAEEAGGRYLSAGGEYYFDGYLEDPTRLLALRHEIGEMVEELTRAAIR